MSIFKEKVKISLQQCSKGLNSCKRSRYLTVKIAEIALLISNYVKLKDRIQYQMYINNFQASEILYDSVHIQNYKKIYMKCLVYFFITSIFFGRFSKTGIRFIINQNTQLHS